MNSLANEFSGIWRLIRLILRRDRIKLPVTITAVGLLTLMFVTGTQQIFESEREMRQGIAFLSANPAMRLFGLPTGDTYGHLLMLRTFSFIAIITSLVSTFTVVRHTRQNEELGRSELVRSGAVGRYADLGAALLVVVGMNIVIGVLSYVGLLSGDLPEAGARFMALSISAVGIAFGGIGLLVAQLTHSSRAANGLASASIMVSMVFSGIGSVLGQLRPSGFEVDPAAIIWLSPIGWGQMVKPFAENNVYVFSIFLVFFVMCILLAFYLSARRDVGRAIFNTRNGRRAAQKNLLTPSGLVWRLNKGVFLSWLTGLTLLGAIYGLIAGDVEDLLAQAEGIAEIFVSATGSSEIMFAFFGSIVSVLAVFALAYGVQVTLRMRHEELRSLENILATKLVRTRWMMAHLSFIILSTFCVLVAAGLSMGLVAGLTIGDVAGTVWPITAGAISQLPGIFVVLGFSVAAFGIIPAWNSTVAWLSAAVAVLFGPFLGSLLNVPEVFMNISALHHTPVVPPLDNLGLLPLAVLVSIASTLFILGIVWFRRRDISTT